MKKYLLIVLCIGLSPLFSCGMTEEEEMEAAIKASLLVPQKSNYADITAVLEESQQTATDEKERILPAGIYDRNIDGHSIKQLALSDNDRQSNENITCGPKVLFIAQALTNLVHKKKTIDPTTMSHALEKLKYGVRTNAQQCKTQLASENIDRYIEKNKISLPSYFALASLNNEIIPLETNNDPYNIPENLTTTNDLSNLLEKNIARSLGTKGLKSVHFICNDSRAQHWFLISVVKTQNQITLWYIDPKNTDANFYPYAFPFITYIYTHLVNPAYAALLNNDV